MTEKQTTISHDIKKALYRIKDKIQEKVSYGTGTLCYDNETSLLLAIHVDLEKALEKTNKLEGI